jgi:hypothetical protein
MYVPPEGNGQGIVGFGEKLPTPGKADHFDPPEPPSPPGLPYIGAKLLRAPGPDQTQAGVFPQETLHGGPGQIQELIIHLNTQYRRIRIQESQQQGKAVSV